MGAGSSVELPAPQDGTGAAEPPRTPPEPLPAEEEAEPQASAEPVKVLDASSPVPDVNEDSLEHDAPPQEPQQPGAITAPQELDGQQAEVASPLEGLSGEQAEAAGTNVGQKEHSSVTLKEDTETMETSPSDSSTRDGVDAEKEDAHAVNQLPSSEEDAEDQASEPQSYHLGFKKVFKFFGFRFTVKKEKTGKSEPVQLLTVKKETQVPEGADDQKEVSSEERVMPEDALSAEDTTEDTLKNDKPEDESPKTPEANEICSQSAALATNTASPLRKLFTQEWTGFRKNKSFRKPKNNKLQSPTKEEEQEKEGATLTTETTEKEENSELKKQDEEKNVTAVTIEAHEKEQTEGEKQELEKTVAATGVEASEKEELTMLDEQGQKEDVAAASVKESVKEKKAEEDQERKLVETSEDLGKKEEKTEGEKASEVTEKPQETASVVPVVADSVNGELKISSKVLPVGEKPEPVEKCEIDDRTEISSEEKLEEGSLAIENSSEQLKKTEGREGNIPALLGKETHDEKTEEAELKTSPAEEVITKGDAQDRTTEKKESKEHETKLTSDAPGLKSFSISECSVDTEDDQQSIRPTDEGLQGKTGIVTTDTVKPDEITAEEASEKKPPEGITNEADLLSSQEKQKVQGSPLKKLFTGTGLKKLPGKKHKGKREESKLGKQGEPIQHLSDSPDSPEEQKGESSASSPEEMNEIPSLEKPVDGMQGTENEDAAISGVEQKRESVTPWASFKKMVTPKKRVRRPSESDKEEETDKTKSIAASATENTVDESQGEIKENGVDQKPEKTTEEPKRKVDTSVSWEAFICVGSSKKRARKLSSSDEETKDKLGQEAQKVEESGQSKETTTDAVFTSSQESDQGQGNSSPEQAGSPSEGEGISTWESFKRLVIPRRRSKTRMEEKTDDSVGSSLEHLLDGEPGKNESWVPFRKLVPGRRKKKSNGKPEPACVKQAKEDMAETTEEDSDIPAVVPLSEYEAAEQEKMEAQKAKDAEATREQASKEERAEKLEKTLRTEQAHEGLLRAVTVVEGERVVTNIEERSPSWISAALTECIEQAEEEGEKETEKILESDVIVEEAVTAAKTVPEARKDISDDTTIEEPSSHDREFHSIKAVTPQEEPIAKQEPSEQEKLPTTELTVDETRDECIPKVQTAVQDKADDETASLKSEAEELVQPEGQDETLTVVPECTVPIVTVVLVKPEKQDEIPDLGSGDPAYVKGVPGRVLARREKEKDGTVLLGVESTEVTVTEVPLQNEVKTSALASETAGSEAAADAEPSVVDGAVRHVTAKDSVPVLELQCREKKTETSSPSDETKSGKMEDAVLKTETHSESDTTVTEAAAQIEADSASALASTCPDITENGSTVLTDLSPKKYETPRSFAGEETLEKEQELSNSQDFDKDDDENEQLVERAEEVLESGKQEAVRADATSAAVQQEVLTVQDKGSGSAFLQAEGMEALNVPVPVAAAAVEEPVIAENITPTDMPAETVQPLATTSEQMASEEVQITAVDYSGWGTADLGNAEAPEPQVSPASMNGISEEQERLQSTRQPEQNGILSDSLSVTHTEFEQDVVQSVTIESQSTKIVLNAIQTAVHKLAEAEESAAFESEQHIKSTGKSPLDTNTSELLESMKVDHQLPVKEGGICSKEQELQQSVIVKTATLTDSAEILSTVEKTKDMLLTSEMLKDGQSQNSFTFITRPEDVSRESVRLQKSTLELSTSEDSTKDLLDIHLPELREKEAGQIMEIPDQHTSQQTCRESEEDHHRSPVEDGKRQTPEDGSGQEGTFCGSPQSQNSVAADALNMC